MDSVAGKQNLRQLRVGSAAMLALCLLAACTSRATVLKRSVTASIAATPAPTPGGSMPSVSPWVILDSPLRGSSNATELRSSLQAQGASHYAWAWISGGEAKCPAAQFSSPTEVSTPLVLPLGDDGLKELCLKGQDASGRVFSFSYYSWQKDTAAPTLVPEGLPQPLSTSALLTLTLRGEGLSAYRWALGTQQIACAAPSLTWLPWTSALQPVNASLPLEGPLRLCLQGRDEAGNETEIQTHDWTLDRTAPGGLAFSGVPVSPHYGASTNISVTNSSGSDAVEYQYGLVTDPAANGCASVHYSPWRPLAEKIVEYVSGSGPRTICARGRDAAQNVQPVPSATTWTQVADQGEAASFAIISGTPANSLVTNAALADYTISGTGVASYQYAIAPGGACPAYQASLASKPSSDKLDASLAGISGLGSVCVWGRTASGTVQQDPAHWTFIRDAIAPIPTQITLTPNSFSGISTTLETSVSGDAGDVVEYRHVVVASANCDAAAAQLAAAPWLPKSLPIQASLSGSGPRSLCIQTRDQAGNLMGTASGDFIAGKTSLSWTQQVVNTTATGVPVGVSSATTMTLDFAVTPGGEGKSVHYALLSGTGSCETATYTEATLVGGADVTGLPLGADGAKTLCLRGELNNSRIQETATVYNWIKDTTIPFATVTGLPADGVLNATSVAATLANFGDTSAYRFVTLPGAAPALCSAATYVGGGINPNTTNIMNLAGLADGNVRLCVELKDAAQNTAYLSYDFSVNTEPLTSLVSAPSVAISGPEQDVSFTVTVSGYGAAGYKYGIKAGNDCTGVTYSALNAPTTPISISGASLPDTNTAQETYSLCVKAANANGSQLQATPTRATWLHDTLSPANNSVAFTAHLPAQASVRNASQLVIATGAPLQFAGSNDSGSTFAKYKYKILKFTESEQTSAPGGAQCNTSKIPLQESLATWVASAAPLPELILASENGWVLFCACAADGVGNTAPGCRDLAASSDAIPGTSWLTRAFKVDVTAPSITTFFLRDSDTGSDSWTNATTVKAVFEVSSDMAALCVTRTATPPATGDGCWTTTFADFVNVTGGTAAKSFDVNLDGATLFNGALAAQTAGTDQTSYTLYGWAKDSANNVTQTTKTASIIYDKPSVGSDWVEFATTAANTSSNGLFLASQFKLNILADIGALSSNNWYYVMPRGHLSVRFPTAGLNNTSGNRDNPDGFTRIRIYACHPSDPTSTAACELRTPCATWNQQDCVKLMSDDPDFTFNPLWGNQMVVDLGGLPDDKVTFFNVRPATSAFEHQNNFWFGTQTGSDLSKRGAHNLPYSRPSHAVGVWADTDKHLARTATAPTFPTGVSLTSNSTLSAALADLSAISDYLMAWAHDSGVGQGMLGILAGPVRSGDGDSVRFRARVIGERVYPNEDKTLAKAYAPMANLFRPEGLALVTANAVAVNTTQNTVAADVKDQTLYVSDTEKHRILRLDLSTGIYEVYAGTGAYGFNGDGLHRSRTRFYAPKAISIDKQGNLFVADSMNNRVRRIDRVTGVVTTVMGNGQPFTNANATAVGPQCFVTNIANDTPDEGAEVQWRKWWTAEGCPASLPEGVFVLDTTDDAAPARRTYELYVARTGEHCIHRVKQIGGVWKSRLVSGSCHESDAGLNMARYGSAASWAHGVNSRPLREDILEFPESVAAEVDPTGTARTVYVSDTGNHILFKVDLDSALLGDTDLDSTVPNPSKVTWLAGRRGNGQPAWQNDTNEWKEFYYHPYLFPRSFIGYVEDGTWGRAGFYEGNGGDNVSDSEAPRLFEPTGLALLPSNPHLGTTEAEARYGRVVFADRMSHRVRMVLQDKDTGTGLPDPTKNYRNMAPRLAGGQHTATFGSTAWGDGSGPFTGFVDGSNAHFRYDKECANGDRLLYHWSYLLPAGYRNPGRGSYKDDNGGTKHRWSSCWNQPSAVAVSSDGSTLYVADKMNNLIRKVKINWANHNIDDATNEVVTIMGSTRATQSGNRATTADGGNWSLRETGDGSPGAPWTSHPASTCAGNTDTCWGYSHYQTFSNPRGIATDFSRGLVFVADRDNNRVVMLRNYLAGGQRYWDAKTLVHGNMRDGVNRPSDVAYNPINRMLYVADTGNNRILKFTVDDDTSPSNGNEYTINKGRVVLIGEADNTIRNSGVGGSCSGASAQLNSPEGIDVDAWGNLIIADTGNNRIVRAILNADGTCNTNFGLEHVAGDPNATATTPSEDGPNPQVRRVLAPVDVVAVGRDIYFSERNGHRIRKVSGVPDVWDSGFNQRNWSFASLVSVVGTGTAGFSPNGTLATEANIDAPHGIFYDAAKGVLYFADTFNHVIRKVENGRVYTVVGSGTAGDEGVSGYATNARLFLPWGVGINHLGHLVFTDMNHMVKVVPLNSRPPR